MQKKKKLILEPAGEQKLTRAAFRRHLQTSYRLE